MHINNWSGGLILTTNTSVLEKPPVNHPPSTKIANTQPGGRYIREGTAFCARLERVLRSCAYVDFRECQLALVNDSRSWWLAQNASAHVAPPPNREAGAGFRKK